MKSFIKTPIKYCVMSPPQPHAGVMIRRLHDAIFDRRTNKSSLIIIAAMILSASLPCPVAANDDNKPSITRQDTAISDTSIVSQKVNATSDTAAVVSQKDNAISDTSAVSPQPRDTAVSDTTVSPQQNTDVPATGLPVLKIGGRNSPDVYLQSLDIQTDITGNIASTRYTMVFRNRSYDVLSGELTFPLPDGSAVTHYALDVEGRMREAVPVEKAKATRVFEEIMQRPPPIDPGILEMVEGNSYRTRIYPFPSRGTRTISIGYEMELAFENDSLYYLLPVVFNAPIEKFSLSVTVWGSDKKPRVSGINEDSVNFAETGDGYTVSFAKENYASSGALAFALPAPADAPQVIMQSSPDDHYFLASVFPNIEARKKQWSDELAIIWDVSLSGLRRDRKREIEILDIIFADRKTAGVRLYFLNNRLSESINKNAADGSYKVANGNWDELKKALETAIYDGGTDFSQIDPANIAGKEILFFSDGISTLGDIDFINHTGVDRPIHCVVSSATADHGAMRLIAGKTNGKFVNAAALPPESLRKELLYETLQYLGAEHGGSIRELYPAAGTPVYGNFSVAGIVSPSTLPLRINDKTESQIPEMTLLFGFGGKVEKRIKVRLYTKARRSIASSLEYEEQMGHFDQTLLQIDHVTGEYKVADPPPRTPANIYEIWAQRGNLDMESVKRGKNIRKIWAQKKIAELDKNYEANRDEIEKLGKRFGIVTRNTTLMVLELVDDYIRYGIEPPPELRAEYRRRSSWQTRRDTERNLLNTAVSAVGPKRRPLGTRKAGKTVTANHSRINIYANEVREPYEQPVLTVNNMEIMTVIDVKKRHLKIRTASGVEGYVLKNEVGKPTRNALYNHRTSMAFESADVVGYLDNPTPVYIIDMDDPQSDPVPPPADLPKGAVVVTDIRTDSDYSDSLTGRAADDYQIYLKLRDDHGYANTPAFYFYMADRFYKLGDRETALRILTSIAELDLENAPLYRMLGYKLKEYGEYGLQKFVCGKVMAWRPMEPQSYRDYALALADNGEDQAALDSLYGLLKRPYSSHIANRSRGIEETVAMEISRLIAKNPRLRTKHIDSRLKIKAAADIRVVLNWNQNDVDLDLIAVTPHGTEYGFKYPYAWPFLGVDNTSGYGPEQLVMRNAAPGKYRFFVKHKNSREFASAEPITVMAEIYTKYAGKKEERRVVTLMLPATFDRWRDNDARLLLAEIEF